LSSKLLKRNDYLQVDFLIIFRITDTKGGFLTAGAMHVQILVNNKLILTQIINDTQLGDIQRSIAQDWETDANQLISMNLLQDDTYK
jgi:hypothetical protein